MLKKMLIAGAAVATLAFPASAQTVNAGDVLNTVRNVYDAATGQYNNGGYYNNGVYYNNGYNNGYYNNGYYNNGYNNGYYNNGQVFNNYSLSSPNDVVFTNLGQGSTVGQNFVVDGYTQPGNRVNIVVNSQFLGPGAWRNTVRADGNGRFSSNVDVSNVPINGQVQVTMQANNGPARSITVVRTQ